MFGTSRKLEELRRKVVENEIDDNTMKGEIKTLFTDQQTILTRLARIEGEVNNLSCKDELKGDSGFVDWVLKDYSNGKVGLELRGFDPKPFWNTHRSTIRTFSNQEVHQLRDLLNQHLGNPYRKPSIAVDPRIERIKDNKKHLEELQECSFIRFL